jgi:hypothetical protein
MTIHPDDPKRHTTNPRAVRDRAGPSNAMMAAIAVALALGLGILFYALNRDDRTASTTASPTTTGQTQKAPAVSPAPVPAPKAQ